MPAPSDRPLRKVTLNLFADDVAYLEKHYGRGWTDEVRRSASEFVKLRKDVDKILKQSEVHDGR